MINTLKHGALLVAAIFTVATPAWSQAPTDAQRNAIRSAMPRRLSGALRQHPAGRRGFAAVPAEKHVEPLVRLPGRGARGRTRGGAEGGDGARGSTQGRIRTGLRARCCSREARNRGSGSSPESCAARAGKPTDAQVAAVRSACRSDYQKVCAGVPTGGAPALQCLEKNKAKVSAPCAQAVNAASGGAAPAAGGAAATASPAAAVVRSARGHRVAADATARGIVRAEVGMQRRRSHAVRRRCARRRPDHAMSGDAGRLDFAGVQGRADPVRGAVIKQAVSYSPRNARISWINRTDSET